MKKRLFSYFLVVMMLVSMMVTTTFATDTVGELHESTLEDFCIEVSLEDLQSGVTVALENDGDGNYVVRQLSPEEAFELKNGKANTKIEATFHCGLDYNKGTHRAALHWNATGKQLTRVQATLFCRNTSAYPYYHFNDSIDGYSDLSGRYNQASGTTYSFDIPTSDEKVQIGWSSAYVTTVKNGKLSMPSAIQTLTPADLPHTNVQ